MDVRHPAAVSNCLALAAFMLGQAVQAADWDRFRGPNGSGVSADEKPAPTVWSETQNLKWKVELPGPGSSCPIVVGDRVLVTCWSGYGLDARNPGDQKDLRRHLVCIDRRSGETLWSRAVEPVLPEDPYRGMFAEHGYASHTPVSDGRHVYVFFGKSGVLAFDLEGNQLWQTSVGTGSDRRGWGSAASPILYKNLVIVTASAESESMVALDKQTGEQVWKQNANGFAATWGTPILVDLPDDRQELVLAVPYELWGFNPDTGKLRWYCEVPGSDSMCASAVAHQGVVYLLGDRGGAVAVRAGGEADVTKTHILWSADARARINTPILHDGRIYWISQGIANCVDAASGQRIYQARLGGSSGTAAPEPPGDTPARPGGEQRRRFGGGFAGGFARGGGGQDYASPVVADGKLYFVSRSGLTHVVALGPTFELLAQNRFASDTGDFSATPAISDGEIFIRSSKYVYCVANAE